MYCQTWHALKFWYIFFVVDFNGIFYIYRSVADRNTHTVHYLHIPKGCNVLGFWVWLGAPWDVIPLVRCWTGAGCGGPIVAFGLGSGLGVTDLLLVWIMEKRILDQWFSLLCFRVDVSPDYCWCSPCLFFVFSFFYVNKMLTVHLF